MEVRSLILFGSSAKSKRAVQTSAALNSSVLSIGLTTQAQMGVWLATIAVLLFDPKYYDSARAPREMYDSIALQVVQTDWPHDFFRPSALACSASGRHLMLGDQFAIFKAELELLGEHSDESAVERMEEEASRNHTHERISLKTITLEMAVPTTEIDFAFKSFGFLPGKNKLLLLNQGGTEITEYSLHGHRYVKTWKLSPTLPHKRLETIQPVEGQETLQCARDGSGFMNAGWLVYAATDSGQASQDHAANVCSGNLVLFGYVLKVCPCMHREPMAALTVFVFVVASVPIPAGRHLVPHTSE